MNVINNMYNYFQIKEGFLRGGHMLRKTVDRDRRYTR